MRLCAAYVAAPHVLILGAERRGTLAQHENVLLPAQDAVDHALQVGARVDLAGEQRPASSLDLLAQVVDIDLGNSIFVNGLQLHLDLVDLGLFLLRGQVIGTPHGQEVDLEESEHRIQFACRRSKLLFIDLDDLGLSKRTSYSQILTVFLLILKHRLSCAIVPDFWVLGARFFDHLDRVLLVFGVHNHDYFLLEIDCGRLSLVNGLVVKQRLRISVSRRIL